MLPPRSLFFLFLGLLAVDTRGGTPGDLPAAVSSYLGGVFPSDTLSDPPVLLSETGAFSDTANLVPAPSLLPYTVGSKLWSDRAVKTRWIALPRLGAGYAASEQIVFSEDESWLFPAGTVLVKHFELPIDESDPSITTRLETRFMVCTPGGEKYGVTYRWRADQSDADLLTTDESGDYLVQEAGGGSHLQTWDFPSRSDCLSCHNETSGQALGVRTHQLNLDYTYPSGGRCNQLERWNTLGMFDEDLTPSQLANFLRSHPLDDESVPLEHRVRSYLDSNCTHCHGAGSAFFDSRLSAPLMSQGLINGPITGTFLFPNGTYVTPGKIASSAVPFRMDHVLDQNAMPPLGRRLVNEDAVQATENWVLGLTKGEFSEAGGTRPVRALLGGPAQREPGLLRVTLILDEDCSGVEAGDFQVTNGAVAALTGSGYYYTASIKPTASPVSVTFAAASATGTSGNSNSASETVVIAGLTDYDLWAAAAGLSGSAAGMLADPDRNGHPNLLEWSCNLTPGDPAPGVYDPAGPLDPAGPSGLPRIEVVETAPDQHRVRLRFLRRTLAAGQGFSYQAEFSESLLAGEWTPSPSAPVVTPINPDWERVTVEDHLTASHRFARVAISFSP